MIAVQCFVLNDSGVFTNSVTGQTESGRPESPGRGCQGRSSGWVWRQVKSQKLKTNM